MVPSHIQIKTLSQILLRTGVNLSAKHDMQQALSDLTVDEVYKKYTANNATAEQSNNVLDLVFDIDQVNISKEEQAANAEQDSVDLV